MINMTNQHLLGKNLDEIGSQTTIRPKSPRTNTVTPS